MTSLCLYGLLWQYGWSSTPCADWNAPGEREKRMSDTPDIQWLIARVHNLEYAILRHKTLLENSKCYHTALENEANKDLWEIVGRSSECLVRQ